MPIYRNLLELEKSPYLYDLFDAMHPFVIVDRILAVEDYLQAGDLASVLPGDPEIEPLYVHDQTVILDILYSCIKEMIASPVDAETITLADGTLISVAPFYDMLDELGSLEDAVDELEELARVLVHFLHAGNIQDYKRCRDTVEQLTILMRGIYIDLLKK